MKIFFRTITGFILITGAFIAAYFSILHLLKNQWEWISVLIFTIVMCYIGVSLLMGRKMKSIFKDLLDMLMWWP